MSLARILGKQQGRQSFISDSRWVLPTCFVGLEFEYEGVKNSVLPKHTYADFWAYHEEGSLKDNGAEYAFSTPLFGVDAYNATDWLVSYASDNKWKCTKRTGIHVHIDVRDLTVPQLSGQTILYTAVEPMLYRWIGDARDASHFCIPLYRADDALQAACTIIKSAYSDDRLDSHSSIGASEEFQRYAGYNLQALAKFGSVEYRHMQTTHDKQRVYDWINMIMSLKAATFRLPHSDGAAIRMIQRMNALELLHYIFPKDLAEKLYTKDSDEELFSLGLPAARDIAVHGCGDTDWIKHDFPKGEHAGFAKWMKNSKPSKKTRPVEEGIYFDEPVEEEEDIEDFEDRPPPVVGWANADPAPAPALAMQEAPIEQLQGAAGFRIPNWVVDPLRDPDRLRDLELNIERDRNVFIAPPAPAPRRRR